MMCSHNDINMSSSCDQTFSIVLSSIRHLVGAKGFCFYALVSPCSHASSHKTTIKNQLFITLPLPKMSTKKAKVTFPRKKRFKCTTCAQVFFTISSSSRKKKIHTKKIFCSQCENNLCSPIQPEKKEIMCAYCTTNIEKFRDIELAGTRIRIANDLLLKSIDNTIYNRNPNGYKLCPTVNPRIVSAIAGFELFIKCHDILEAFGEKLSLRQVYERLTVKEKVLDWKNEEVEVEKVVKDEPVVNHAKDEIQIYRRKLFEPGSRLQV